MITLVNKFSEHNKIRSPYVGGLHPPSSLHSISSLSPRWSAVGAVQNTAETSWLRDRDKLISWYGGQDRAGGGPRQLPGQRVTWPTTTGEVVTHSDNLSTIALACSQPVNKLIQVRPLTAALMRFGSTGSAKAYSWPISFSFCACACAPLRAEKFFAVA